MAEPTALGAVLATLLDRSGKPVRGGAVRGQLYATPEAVTVLRPTAREEALHRIATGLLLGSVAAVIANVILWRSTAVLWAALAAQAVYWLTLPVRRRGLEPAPLGAAGLDEARRAGRAAIHVPVGDVVSLEAPEPPRAGFRRPARIALAGGALEIYLSPEAFETLRSAIARR